MMTYLYFGHVIFQPSKLKLKSHVLISESVWTNNKVYFHRPSTFTLFVFLIHDLHFQSFGLNDRPVYPNLPSTSNLSQLNNLSNFSLVKEFLKITIFMIKKFETNQI